MPKGVYDRKKASFNPGMFKKGKKAPKWLVRRRALGLRRAKPNWNVEV